MENDNQEKEYAQVLADVAKYEKEVAEHNKSLIASIHPDAPKDFIDLIDYVTIEGKIEIVSEPKGDNQDEQYGIFNKVYVDQRSVGMSGDSFEGEIYAKFGENKWLKIPYSC